MTGSVQASSAPDRALGIAEIAARSGLTQTAIRWYEREGMLPSVPRGDDRRRHYTEDDAARVSFLALMRRSGMSTTNLRELSQVLADPEATPHRQLEILAAHRTFLQTRRQDLVQALAAIDEATSKAEKSQTL